MSDFGLAISLRSYGVRDAMKALERGMAETQAVLTAALVAQAEALKTELAAATPERDYEPGEPHGPHARASYSVVVVSPTQVEVRNPTPQSHILLSGSKEHDITVVNAPYLVFRSREGGLARLQAVHHPGTARNPAMVAVVRTFSFQARAVGRSLGGRIAVSYGRSVLTEDV